MRFVRGRIVLVLVVLLVVVRLGDMAMRQNFYGPGPLAASRDVVIPRAPVAALAALLRQEGVIAYPLMFRAAAYVTRGRGPLRAGEYLVPAHASLADVLNILRFAAPVEHQVTIPEGLTAVQIAAVLNGAQAAAGTVAAPVEGSVLPQTYDYTLGTERGTIMRRAQTAMDRTLAAAWAGRDAGVPLATPAEALTLASIVQQESPLAAELPEIAAVYENRLARGMKLQADPTVIYAASGGKASGGLPISRADLDNPSPYNTYLVAGLPPGPVAAPGLAAIQAVLHPARSEALYFVATGTGGHVFADDFMQQLANIARYRAVVRGGLGQEGPPAAGAGRPRTP